MLEAQLPFIAALQGVAQWGPIFLLLKTAIFLAEENVIILCTCALFWLVDRKVALRALVLVLISEYINFLLKWSFHMPRPYWMSADILPLSRQPDFGFPTAYAQDALVYWYIIAQALSLRYENRKFWLLPAIIVPLVCAATVMLGANFFHDTLAGVLVGALILVAARYAQPALHKLLAKNNALRIGIFLGFVPVLFGIVALRGATIGEVKIEGTWRALAMAGTTLPPYLVFSPWSSNAVFTIGAGLLAAVAATEMSKRGLLAPFIVPNEKRTVFNRLIVGLMGLVVLKFIMALALDQARDLGVGIVYFVGYLFVGLWALAGAPWVFRFSESSAWFRDAFRLEGEAK